MPYLTVQRNRRFDRIVAARSEEHTSELQSHDNLVCRLLLEKTENSPAIAIDRPSGAPAARGHSQRSPDPPSTASVGAATSLFFFQNGGPTAYRPLSPPQAAPE